MEDKKLLNFVRRNLIISQGLSRTLADSTEEQQLHIQRCLNALSNSNLKDSNLFKEAHNPELDLDKKRDLIWKLIKNKAFDFKKIFRFNKLIKQSLLVIALIVAINLLIKASHQHALWKVEFYGNADLHGEPIAEREENYLDFEWSGSPPHNRVDGGRFSASWKSCLVLNENKTLKFNLGSDDGSRLIIDGKKIIEKWQIQGYAEQSKELTLKAGGHKIEVQYYQDGGASRLKFEIDNNHTSRFLKSSLGAFSPCKK